MATVAATATPESRAGSRWLYGPWSDMLFGCGGLYALAVVALFATPLGRLAVDWAVVASALLAIFVNGPHYGATLLRVYEQRDERRKYAFFAVWVTLALCVLFVVGLHVSLLGSLLLTAYFTWTPWHFSGQNYGLALLFLRRRGVPVTPVTKRFLYVSFLLSCAVTLLGLHGVHPQLSLAPVPSEESALFHFMTLGIPDTVRLPLLVGSFVAYLATLVVAAALLLREARPRDLVPSACLVLAQASWFAVPAMFALGGSTGLRNIALSTIWIALAHSVQYLWVTSYFARESGRAASFGSFLAKCTVAGACVIVLPAALLAPDLLGPVPYDAGLAILLFSVVNLHHFILDGAIWKLRDGRIARVLIRRDVPEAPASPGPRRSVLTYALYAVGTLALAIEVASVLEQDLGWRRALERSEMGRASTALRRLDWLGRESGRLELRLAEEIRTRGGSPARVRSHLERSLELQPTPKAWVRLGLLEHQQGNHEAALRAFDEALALDPDLAEAYALSGFAWSAIGRPELALQSLDRARTLGAESEEAARLRRTVEARIRGAGGS